MSNEFESFLDDLPEFAGYETADTRYTITLNLPNGTYSETYFHRYEEAVGYIKKWRDEATSIDIEAEYRVFAHPTLEEFMPKEEA